jgi:hypothetical protein
LDGDVSVWSPSVACPKTRVRERSTGNLIFSKYRLRSGLYNVGQNDIDNFPDCQAEGESDFSWPAAAQKGRDDFQFISLLRIQADIIKKFILL